MQIESVTSILCQPLKIQIYQPLKIQICFCATLVDNHRSCEYLGIWVVHFYCDRLLVAWPPTWLFRMIFVAGAALHWYIIPVHLCQLMNWMATVIHHFDWLDKYGFSDSFESLSGLGFTPRAGLTAGILQNVMHDYWHIKWDAKHMSSPPRWRLYEGIPMRRGTPRWRLIQRVQTKSWQ